MQRGELWAKPDENISEYNISGLSWNKYKWDMSAFWLWVRSAKVRAQIFITGVVALIVIGCIYFRGRLALGLILGSAASARAANLGLRIAHPDTESSIL